MISPVTNRVPFSEIISSFDDYYDKDEDLNERKKFPHRPGNLIYNPNFILILNDFVYSFQEISGIDIDFPNEHSLTEGGNSRHLFARKTLMEEDTTNLILKRAMPIRRSQTKVQNISALLSLVTPSGVGFLRKQSLLAAAKLDPVYTLEHGPAEGIIQIFDRTFKNDVANFRFFSYGAHKWTLGELDATSGNIVYETIELICTNFTRVLPSSVQARDQNIWINLINGAKSQEFNDLETASNKRLEEQKKLDEDEDAKKSKEAWEKKQKGLKTEQEKREKEQKDRIDAFKEERKERLKQEAEKQKKIKEELEEREKKQKEKAEELKKRKEEWEKKQKELKTEQEIREEEVKEEQEEREKEQEKRMLKLKNKMNEDKLEALKNEKEELEQELKNKEEESNKKIDELDKQIEESKDKINQLNDPEEKEKAQKELKKLQKNKENINEEIDKLKKKH